MFFTAECTDNRNTGKDFSCYQVQLIYHGLQGCKFRHCDPKQHCHKCHDQYNGHPKDPCHGGISLKHADHTTDSKDRRVKHDTEHHSHYLLDLLDIVRASCDQGCC